MCRGCTGHWTINPPGYYYFSQDQQGTSITYHFRNRTIHCSSYCATPRPGAPPKSVLPSKEDHDLADAQVFDVDDKDHQGWAFFEHTTDESGSFWLLQGFMARGPNLAIVTFCLEDQADRD